MKTYDASHEKWINSELFRQLVDSEQLLRAIFDNAIVPIIVIEPDGRISQTNPAFFQLLGYEPDEHPQLDIRKLSSVGDPSLFDRVVSGEIESYVQEKHYVHKMGDIIDVIVSASALKDKKGNLRCVVAVIQDITALKSLERSIREEKQMLEHLLHHLPVGVNYLRNGRIEYANPEFSRIFGYTPIEIIGYSLETLLFPSLYRKVNEDIQRLTSGEVDKVRLEGPARTKNGHNIFIETIITLGRIEDQDCIIGLVNDLTLSKQLEARYQLLFEAANDIILVLDPATLRIIDANPKAIEIYGYSRSELQRMTVREITELPSRREQPEVESEQIEEWPAGIYPRVQIKKNGEKVQVEVSSSLVDWQGRKSMISMVRDVTEQRRLQQQLMQADKLASLGSLVAGIAHEINNPNNFISFNVPILEEYWQEVLPILDQYAAKHKDWAILGMSYEEFRSDMLKLLGNMQHGSERISAIVSELRDFARVQKDEYRAWVDVEKLVSRVMTLTGKQVGKLVSKYEFEVSSELPEIFVNPARIEQVLVNLILNAAQAADKEQSFVRLRVFHNPRNREEIVFEVTDNGCGMDEVTRKRVFDPFFTTKEGQEGTGLGLSISYAIVQDHNGSINIDSAPGKGTTMQVLLPIAGGNK